ncbi:FadR/GntR family transcriptional regulator [Bacillus andreraoultii]|uniref:FadR/GntR family transcriptional regulator n=1 Tax=Bacillus andreraoultii TaxID=1499685 RepID=UPI0005399AF1|nr:GntR family transcriptional regulator [Bacillus andreraoultii]
MIQQVNQPKVYVETLEKIKEIINEKKLNPGDKLPSERELADILQVGRSSVREALRAMELLGLIETRRGEGTFVLDFQSHHLVEILSGFILQRNEAKNDVKETKKILETSIIIYLITNHIDVDITTWKKKVDIDKYLFFEHIIHLTNNQLLLKIWYILSNFESSLQKSCKMIDKKWYIELITAINNEDLVLALKIYDQYF